MFEEIFAPGRKHTRDEQKRLELSRVDVDPNDPGRGPIDLTSGKVTIRVPEEPGHEDSDPVDSEAAHSEAVDSGAVDPEAVDCGGRESPATESGAGNGPENGPEGPAASGGEARGKTSRG
ncbi:DUF6191 domain-containing protein [Streptomyces sp. NPDC088258]|uniref:DUF6191 domain-containing protein n=1 Tax=Streptomyces sp. NPDC088258 TaxID=3365849 RepID=UPI003828E3EC